MLLLWMVLFPNVLGHVVDCAAWKMSNGESEYIFNHRVDLETANFLVFFVASAGSLSLTPVFEVLLI